MITPLQKAQLISYMTGDSVDKIRLYSDSVTFDEQKLQEYIDRVEAGETVGRITGKRWFWKHEFLIESTLEPRADSEILIEAVLKTHSDRNRKLSILDIGTGSGCLVLSLLGEYPHAKGTAIDKSPAALATARKNSDNLGFECEFFEMDFMRELPAGDFDIIISNPPYIKSGDIETLDTNVKDFDPLMALDGGEDGLDAYREILEKAKSPEIFFEIGQGQEYDIAEIAARHGYVLAETYKDLGDIIRILAFVKVSD